MITSELVTRLVAKGRQIDTTDRATVLGAAREGDHKCAAILLSAWRKEGHTLSPEEAAELEAHERRRNSYRKIFDELSSFADFYAIKGSYIAGLYPEGIVRQSRDLDLVVSEREHFWTIVRYLVENGWEISTFTVWKVDGRLRTIAELAREASEPELDLPDSVHVSGVGYPGNFWSGVRARGVVAHEGSNHSPAGDLLRVISERLERPFASRDVLDALVLAEAMTGRDVELFGQLLNSFGLWREWTELAESTNRLRSLPLALPTSPLRVQSVRTDVRRLGSKIAAFLPPTRGIAAYGQLRMLEGSTARIDRLVVEQVLRRVPARWALERGLPLFGLLDSPTTHVSIGELALESEGRFLRCATPVGTFLLGPSDEVGSG